MGLSEEEINQRVKSAMELVGLNYEEIGEKSPFELSGGQMRRVALAGVLAMQPRYLVLDEPTAGLDPKGRYYLLNDIKRLHKQGTTIVIISHSMDDVAWLAKRIAVMERGRIVTTGSPKEIFSQYSFLSDMGLVFPPASELSYKLIEKGIPINNCFKLEELADELEKLLKRGGKPVRNFTLGQFYPVDSLSIGLMRAVKYCLQ